MTTRQVLTVFVQSIFALVILATVTNAQTASSSPATQSFRRVVTNEVAHPLPRGGTDFMPLSCLKLNCISTQDRVSLEEPVERWHLDLSTAKSRTTKSSLLKKTSNSSSGATELSGESTETQDPKPAAAPASNGTNPAELITRVEVKYQYQNFAGGDLHGAIVRGDYAFTPKVSFRIDLPILHFDAQTPGGRSESGIGDIVTSMTFVKVFSKRFVGAVVPRIDFPTATHDSLGSGKYAFKPAVAGVTPLAKGVALVGLLEYRVSFAGNSNRSDINELSLKPILLKSFLEGSLKGFYANPQAEVIVDFEHNNQTTFQMGVHGGKVLSKNVVVFVIPTIHVAGTKRESFKLELGFRYLFR